MEEIKNNKRPKNDLPDKETSPISDLGINGKGINNKRINSIESRHAKNDDLNTSISANSGDNELEALSKIFLSEEAMPYADNANAEKNISNAKGTARQSAYDDGGSTDDINNMGDMDHTDDTGDMNNMDDMFDIVYIDDNDDVFETQARLAETKQEYRKKQPSSGHRKPIHEPHMHNLENISAGLDSASTKTASGVSHSSSNNNNNNSNNNSDSRISNSINSGINSNTKTERAGNTQPAFRASSAEIRQEPQESGAAEKIGETKEIGKAEEIGTIESITAERIGKVDGIDTTNNSTVKNDMAERISLAGSSAAKKSKESAIADKKIASTLKGKTDLPSGRTGKAAGLKISAAPFVNSAEDKRTIMLNFLIATLPLLLWGIYIFGARVITLLLTAIIFCNGFEVLSDVILDLPVRVTELYPTVTAVFITLMLPATSPLWLPVFCAFVATVPLKLLFKKTGFRGLEPALISKLIASVLFPGTMTAFSEPGSFISAISFFPKYESVELTSLETLKLGQLPQTSLMSEFFGKTAGTIGEVSVFLILIGFIYLLITKTITFHVPVVLALTAAIPFYLFPQLPFSSDMLAIKFAGFELFSGELMFCAVFIAAGYISSPKTNTAKLIYGVCCGLLSVLFRFAFKSYDGVGFAVLLMSLVSRPLDRLCIPMPFGGYAEKAKAKLSKKKGNA